MTKLRPRRINQSTPRVTRSAGHWGDQAPCRTPAPASAWGVGPSSHQPQEGGTQHHGGEPAQRALRTAFPHRGLGFRLILCSRAGWEEPLPSGPAELQLQLQRGGVPCRALCGRSQVCSAVSRPALVPERRRAPAPPGPARASVTRERSLPLRRRGAGGPPGSERLPLANQEASSNRKLMWLPWESDFRAQVRRLR